VYLRKIDMHIYLTVEYGR